MTVLVPKKPDHGRKYSLSNLQSHFPKLFAKLEAKTHRSHAASFCPQDPPPQLLSSAARAPSRTAVVRINSISGKFPPSPHACVCV